MRALIITASAFVAQFVTNGWSVGMGLYYVTFLEVFQQSHAVTAWVGSLNYAVLCVTGKFLDFTV